MAATEATKFCRRVRLTVDERSHHRRCGRCRRRRRRRRRRQSHHRIYFGLQEWRKNFHIYF